MNEALYANENASEGKTNGGYIRADFPEYKTIRFLRLVNIEASAIVEKTNKQNGSRRRVARKHAGMFKEGPLKHQIPLQNISDPPLLHLPPSLPPSFRLSVGEGPIPPSTDNTTQHFNLK